MGTFQILTHRRLPILGCAWAVTAVSQEDKKLHAEYFVFVLDDEGNTEQLKEGVIKAPLTCVDGTDASNMINENLMLGFARQCAESTIDRWQVDKYKIEHSAAHLIEAIVLSEPEIGGASFIYRMWMGTYAQEEIRRMREKTKCSELKQLFSETMKLPRIEREDYWFSS